MPPHRTTADFIRTSLDRMRHGEQMTTFINPIALILTLAKPIEGVPGDQVPPIYLAYVAHFASLGWIEPTNDDGGNTTWHITAKGHEAFSTNRTRH